MRNFIRKALTRRISVKGRRRQIELEPSTRLVYGMYFAIITLLSLTALEAIHLVVVKQFSSEIFSAITGLIGTIVGVLLTSKG